MRELERDLPADTSTPPAPAAPSRLVVVGSGRAGTAIARAAAAAGIEVALAGRDDAARLASGAEVVLLCVPDEAIADACSTVAGADPAPAGVGHVSGAGRLDLLEPAARAGATTFSLHPLQTIPDGDTDLRGAPCAVAGSDEGALATAGDLARALGMAPFEVPDDGRAVYHAAACIASNFLVALEESAAALLAQAGVDDPREALTPLVLRTAANWADRGAEALTGPIARGDEATVARHLEALRERAPELVPLYEALAARTRELAPGEGG